MTSDYVFRVENQATVLFLQKVGRTGHLTTLTVRNPDLVSSTWSTLLRPLVDLRGFPSVPTLAALVAASMTLGIITVASTLRDWWALSSVGVLVMARLLNVIVIQRRAKPGWFGVPEKGVKGDLLILLSQDRWVRIKGETDDLKRVTSGQWLRDPTFMESAMVGIATILVFVHFPGNTYPTTPDVFDRYLDIVFVSNATQIGKILIVALLISSAGLLGFANEYTEALQMHGRIIEVTHAPVAYKRRRDLADELIKETKRDAWAVRLGMIHPKKSDSGAEFGPPIM